LCKEKVICEEVIVQNGYTQFESQYMDFRPFLTQDELTNLYLNARLIICHAGTGSMLKGIKLKKKIIAIPRLAKYGEVVDDHQLEIINEFSKLNYIIPWTEDVSLKSLLSKVDSFEPEEYISRKKEIINYLNDFIDSL
jgi:UDP-N-acetylglucosamine transferase subunit ALG13